MTYARAKLVERNSGTLDFITNFFASLAEAYHLKIFKPAMPLWQRLALSVLVAPAMAVLGSVMHEPVTAQLFVGTALGSPVVTLLVEFAVKRFYRNGNKQAQEKINRLARKDD